MSTRHLDAQPWELGQWVEDLLWRQLSPHTQVLYMYVWRAALGKFTWFEKYTCNNYDMYMYMVRRTSRVWIPPEAALHFSQKRGVVFRCSCLPLPCLSDLLAGGGGFDYSTCTVPTQCTVYHSSIPCECVKGVHIRGETPFALYIHVL